MNTCNVYGLLFYASVFEMRLDLFSSNFLWWIKVHVQNIAKYQNSIICIIEFIWKVIYFIVYAALGA